MVANLDKTFIKLPHMEAQVVVGLHTVLPELPINIVVQCGCAFQNLGITMN
jgi:hypothetical protein